MMDNSSIQPDMYDNTTYTPKCMTSFVSKSLIQGKLNVPGLIGIIVFYALVFAVGIYATCKKKKERRANSRQSEEVMIAGRNMNEVLGMFTLSATWVGGDYINGTSEFIINPDYGLLWCQAPVLFSLALIFSGLVFAEKMWKAGYVTMLDPFEQKYGRVLTALLYLAALFGEVSFAALSFSVLGSSLNVIVGLNYTWAVLISAVVAFSYTLVGGIYSVAYTDVVQFIGIVFGLTLALPFAMRHPAVTPISESAKWNKSWLGKPLTGSLISHYIDTGLLCFFGAVPWQLYFQRVLSQKSARKAKILSIGGGVLALLAFIPSSLVGAVAASTDWNATGYRDIGEIPFPACDYPLALPLVMRFLTPLPVAVIGLGAVTAAVMSSSDSSILSSSSMFVHNIYQPLRNSFSTNILHRSEASDTEIVWVLRVAMFFVGGAITIVAITTKSIVVLLVLSADLPYCILFPQLTCAVLLPKTNSYGSFMGLLVSCFLRLSAGEPFMGMPPIIYYPWYNEATGIQHFPVKTLASVSSLLTIIVVSKLAEIAARRSSWMIRCDRILFRNFTEMDTSPEENGNTKSGIEDVLEEHDVLMRPSTKNKNDTEKQNLPQELDALNPVSAL